MNVHDEVFGSPDEQTPWRQPPIIITVASPSGPQGTFQPVEPPAPKPRWRRATILFVLTCLSTWHVGGMLFNPSFGPVGGITYAAALMFILTCHEFGHYLQARRYGVPASPPYFLPVPLPPLGTFGAFIVMRGSQADRKQLFDIGISGPLAGLVPTLVFCLVGLNLSETVSGAAMETGFQLGEPLLFGWMTGWIVGPIETDQNLILHPLAYAGWVGLLLTAVNLIPISQLDGGHVLYALLRRRAHFVARMLLLAAIVAVGTFGLWHWAVMLLFITFMGPEHPPTANDHVPLGRGRIVLGWATLAFMVLGFTPTPFSMVEKEEEPVAVEARTRAGNVEIP
jgi:membrane-associated protease RseP (regulator of RpoE activity)